jgi:hypothetical protein
MQKITDKFHLNRTFSKNLNTPLYALCLRHVTQHNDTQHGVTQSNNTQNNGSQNTDTQNNDSLNK